MRKAWLAYRAIRCIAGAEPVLGEAGASFLPDDRLYPRRSYLVDP
jgi:hypothetical protein